MLPLPQQSNQIVLLPRIRWGRILVEYFLVQYVCDKIKGICQPIIVRLKRLIHDMCTDMVKVSLFN